MIVQISPDTGDIVGWIDLRGLLGPEDRFHRVDVLNGIAYDQRNDRLFVTGKLWPSLFEIELIPRDKEENNQGPLSSAFEPRPKWVSGEATQGLKPETRHLKP